MRQTENSLQLREIEKRIGYEFKDKSLPETAFMHSSYANERKLRSNENMEFFGDAILEFLVSEYLYKNFPDKNEGDFSKSARGSRFAGQPFSRSEENGAGRIFAYIQRSGACDRKFQNKAFRKLVRGGFVCGLSGRRLVCGGKIRIFPLEAVFKRGSRGRRLRKRFQAYSFGILSVRPHRAGIYGRGKKRTSAQSALCLCGERQRRAVGQRRGRL